MQSLTIACLLFLLVQTTVQQGCPDALTCDLSSCPNEEFATCEVNMDTCTVQLLGADGNILDCTDCPPGVTPALCPNPLPCENVSCPSSPDATCVNTFCGGCSYVFINDNGRVFDSSNCPLEQSAVTCSRLAAPENGEILTLDIENQQTWQIGETLLFNCFPGYNLFGDEAVMCQEDGTFAGNPPLCIEEGLSTPNPTPSVTCTDPPVPRLGFIQNAKPSYNVGDVLTFFCPDGTRLEGSQEVSCLSTGLFTEITPNTACQTLLLNECPLIAPENGFVFGNAETASVGEFVQFGCDDGFTRIGRNIILCQNNGLLESDPPLCIDCPPTTTCDIATCPLVSNFSCSINIDECKVEVFDQNGNLLSDENCGRECPIGVPLAGCVSPLPCESDTCPGVPAATCTNNFCAGCSAIFTDANGNILSDGDCRMDNKECPIGVGVATCLGPLPCVNATCPRVPNAVCTNNFCGGCNAVFVDLNGNVLSDEDCSIEIGSNTDPRCPIPTGAGTCSFCQGCESNEICCPNGCGTSCTPIPTTPRPCGGNLPATTCAKDICLRATCPLVPEATCSVDICSCKPVFIDSSGTVLSENNCRPDPRCPIPTGAGTCSFCQGCESNEICCPNGCGTSCTPIPTTPNGCPPDQPIVDCAARPCSVQRCLAFPNATCSDNYCGRCNAVFTDSAGNEVDCTPDSRCPEVEESESCPSTEVCATCSENEICCPAPCGTACITTDDCPPDRPRVNCPRPPCQFASCPGSPGATCVNDYCGRCRAVFRSSNGNLLTAFQCRPKDVCPLGRPRVDCTSVPCDNASCPAVPEATCENDYCGSCVAVFKDSDGNVYNPRQCNPGSFCPILLSILYSNGLRASCSRGSRVGSVCRLFCPYGTIMRGDVSQAQCMENNRWSPNVENATCIRRLQCPPLRNVASISHALYCTNGARVGSRCTVRCKQNYINRGRSSVFCLSSGRWSGTLSNPPCSFRTTCPGGSFQTRCPYSPCRTVRCAAIPQARCVPSCTGCGVNFYYGNRRLTPSQCRRQPSVPRGCSPQRLLLCGNQCRNARCPTNRFVCRVNCDCSTTFYDPITYRRVNCFPRRVGR